MPKTDTDHLACYILLTLDFSTSIKNNLLMHLKKNNPW